MREAVFLQGHPGAGSIDSSGYPKLTRRQKQMLDTAGRFLRYMRPALSVEHTLESLLQTKVQIELKQLSMLVGGEVSERLENMAAALEIRSCGGEVFYLVGDSACVKGVCGLVAQQSVPSVILPRKATLPELGVFAGLSAAVLSGVTCGNLQITKVFDEPEGVAESDVFNACIWVEYGLGLDTIKGRFAVLLPTAFRFHEYSSRLDSICVEKRLSGVVANSIIETVPCRLTLSEVEGLKPDDVVLFPTIQTDGSPFVLRVGRGGFPCRSVICDEEEAAKSFSEVSQNGQTGFLQTGFFAGTKIEILGEYIMTDSTVSGCNSKQEGNDETNALSKERLVQEMEVEAVVEVARTALSADNLVCLNRGSVICLNRPVSGPMDLRAGGKLVARGELVDIEGELGFRILDVV